MKATTHTEVYRRFEGELLRRPFRPWILAISALRLGFKRKLPALLLFTPVGIHAVVNCFKVYLGYLALTEQFLGDDPRATLGAAALQQVLGSGLENVLEFLQGSSVFGLLVVSWYGAGLIAEDRRLGANLLYFARPLTRFGYLSGKFLAACLFGALATVVPTLLICGMASFASPEWSFLKQEWRSILEALAFAMAWVATVSVVVLAISSVVKRKTHALIGIVGFVMVLGGVGEAMAELTRDPRFELLDVFGNFARIGRWLLLDQVDERVGIEAPLLVVGAVWVAAVTVLLARVRKMEVVA